RFRPSVVIDGADPYAEDKWSEVTIGEVTFRVSELCDRCAVTTIDPVTLAKGKEPLRTLAKHRRWDGKTWFGIRLVPRNPGTLRVGDPVSAKAPEPSPGCPAPGRDGRGNDFSGMREAGFPCSVARVTIVGNRDEGAVECRGSRAISGTWPPTGTRSARSCSAGPSVVSRS